jgi:hypothetical protein
MRQFFPGCKYFLPDVAFQGETEASHREQIMALKSQFAKTPEPEILPPERSVRASSDPKYRIALVLAILADALQLALIPLFVEGAESPVADVVDIAVAIAMYLLLGWHWEFLPSFAGKLIPGIDLVPLWTLAVANVYRKSKREMAETSG